MRNALLLLVLVTGCGSAAASAESTAPRAAEQASTASSGAEDAALQVQLDAPGDGELRPLRYRFQPGVVEHGHARMVIVARTTVGGQPMGAGDAPAMLMDFTIETTERVGAAVRYRYSIDRVTFDATGADPAVAARLESTLAPLARLTGDAVVDARGRVLDTHVEVPPDMPAELASSMQQMQDMMRQMMAPLPEEAVGVGAEWKTDSTLSSVGGLRLRQRVFYRLVERDGDRAVLATRVEQSGIPGPIDAGQPGVQVVLVELEGHARGTTTLQLDRMIPVESEMEMEMAQDATIHAEGQAVPMHTDVRMSVATGAR